MVSLNALRNLCSKCGRGSFPTGTRFGAFSSKLILVAERPVKKIALVSSVCHECAWPRVGPVCTKYPICLRHEDRAGVLHFC